MNKKQWLMYLAAVAVGLTALVAFVLFGAGCQQQRDGQVFSFTQQISDLARDGQVKGTLRGRLGAGAEAGIKQAAYLVDPGSYVEFDLTYDYGDPENARNTVPDTQPDDP